MLENRPCAGVALDAENRKSSNILEKMLEMLEDWQPKIEKASG